MHCCLFLNIGQNARYENYIYIYIYCCTLSTENHPRMLHIMRDFRNINIRDTNIKLNLTDFCIRHVIIADLENYGAGETYSATKFRLSSIKIGCMCYSVQWVYTNTHTKRGFNIPSLSPNNGK
jgi:hypothetical protein